MHVVSLEARHVRVRLRRPVKHASHARTDTDNLIVVCKLSDGKLGYGEGVPREYVTGETIDSAIELLKRSDLTRQLKPAAEFPEVLAHAEALTLADVPNDDRKCHGNAARCAVELAYLDAFGKALGEPLMNATKLLAPALYQPAERVQYSAVLLSSKGLKLRLLALGYRVAGFKQLKVKVGIAGHDDVKRLRAVRRCVGGGVDVRIDANEAWTADTAAARLRSLERYGLRSVEQPVPHEQVASLAKVRQEVPIPVMLDESLCGMVDAERAVGGGWCDLFNLRLSKCGGFIPTLRLAEYATKHKLGYQLGCQVGETGVLSAAGRQFACSVGGLVAREGSFDRHLVHDALTTDDVTFSSRGGWAPMLTGSGTGVTVDPARLDAVTVRKEVLIG
jgi:L-alanine-DL-glutamate epimerase-like enolase superfamily enzyme